MQQRKLATEYNYLKGHLEKITRFDNIIGQSEPMLEIFKLIPEIAASDASILLTGETGTGKELVAKAIHAKSDRSRYPFIAINCGSIPDTLLESELFGHRKGAFTGATQTRKGFLEVVAGGTLFLDEIGEISPKMQIDLLRVLEEKKINRIGNSETIPVDFRLISATRKNLEQSIAAGEFREDFYYRINVIHLPLPPLRDRREDIPLLVQHFLKKYSQETTKQVDHISPNALNRLQQYEWTGNVRELQNAIERAVVLSKRRTLRSTDFAFLDPGRPGVKTPTLKELEQDYIVAVLNSCNWNITQSAKILGINRVTLHKKMDRFGIKRIKK